MAFRQHIQRLIVVLMALLMPLWLMAQETAAVTEEVTEEVDVEAEADQPGAGTGVNVLDRGLIQWEIGTEAGHLPGMHVLYLPYSLFRFGLGGRTELRLEYNGALLIDDKPFDDSIPDAIYGPDPLWVGTKIRLWENPGDRQRRWIPNTSLMLNVGLPLTKTMAELTPITGKIDLLFENEWTNWLTMGYEVGVYWLEWAPTPDVFVALNFDFQIHEKWNTYVEWYAQFDPDAIDLNNGGKTFTMCDVNMDFGFTYTPHPRVVLDWYAGFNLYHTEADLRFPQNNCCVGMGVTWLLWHPGMKKK